MMNAALSVLLIDEEVQDRSLTAFMMMSAMAGVGLREVGSETEFRSAVREGSYALIITEASASWAAAGTLLREIRRHQPNSALVVFSSDGSAEARATAEEEGAVHFVVKSSEGFLGLVEVAREVLDRSSARVDSTGGQEPPDDRSLEVQTPIESPEPPEMPESVALPSVRRVTWWGWSVVAVVAIAVGIFAVRDPGTEVEKEPMTAAVTEPAPLVLLETEAEGGTADGGIALPENAAGGSIPLDLGAQDAAPAEATDEPLTLVLRAVEEVWVGLTVDDRQVLDETLTPGDERTFTGQQTATLRVGNAAGLTVSWNGQDLGSLGRPRQVRQISFTASEYAFGRRRPVASEAPER